MGAHIKTLHKVLSIIEVIAFVVAAVFGVLWLREPEGRYEPMTFLITFLGGAGVDLIRRRLLPSAGGIDFEQLRELACHIPDEKALGFIKQLSNESYLALTANNITTYKGGLESDGVRPIREFVDRYRSGNGNFSSLEENAVSALSELPPDALQGRFCVVAVNGFLLGGELITVLFDNPRHALFHVWVRESTVRAFFLTGIEEEKIEKLARYFGGFLSNHEYTR